MKTLVFLSIVLLLVGSCASPKGEDGKEMFASLDSHDSTPILVGKLLANIILIPVYTMVYFGMLFPHDLYR